MEVWDLRKSEINYKDHLITFRETKTGVIRSVVMVDEAEELLKGLPKRADTMQVFPSKKNKDKHYDFRYPFHKALKAAGITDFHWHDLRHTSASYLKMSGVDDRTIMEIMGWKTAAMLKRYTHLSVDHINGAQEKGLATMAG